MSLATLFLPDADSNTLPASFSHGGGPDDGGAESNDIGLRSLMIAISVIPTTFATVVGLGRLYANRKKLSLSDVFVCLAMLLNLGAGVVTIVYSRYFYHKSTFFTGNNAEFEKIFFFWGMALLFSLYFGKTATLMMFLSIFKIKRPMRYAIWVAIVACVILYGSIIGSVSFYTAPHVGETWSTFAGQTGRSLPFSWGILQAAGGLVLDMYIFILPLPVISKLNLSRRRKLQLMALFFVGFLGCLATTVSLVYRIKWIVGDLDIGYGIGVLVICNLVEMNVAVVICSTPAFAGLMRRVMKSDLIKNLRASSDKPNDGGNPKDAGLAAVSPAHATLEQANPAKPKPALRNHAGYAKMDDSWLRTFGSSTVDIEAARDPSETVGGGLRVDKTFDVRHAPISEAGDFTR